MIDYGKSVLKLKIGKENLESFKNNTKFDQITLNQVI